MRRPSLPPFVPPALHAVLASNPGSTMPAGRPLRPASAVFATPTAWMYDDEPEAALGPGAFRLIDIGEDPVPVAGANGLTLQIEVLDTSSPIRIKARLDAAVVVSPNTVEPGTLWTRALRPRIGAITEITLVLGALGPFACHYSIQDGNGVVLFRRTVEAAGESIVPCCFFLIG